MMGLGSLIMLLLVPIPLVGIVVLAIAPNNANRQGTSSNLAWDVS